MTKKKAELMIFC